MSPIKAWFLAARPKTLTAALIPVVTASALAYSHGVFQPLPALYCVLFATWMQIAANLINDFYDYRRGTDGPERLGPERAMAQGWIKPRAMRIGIAITLMLACSAGSALLASSPTPLLLVGVGAACVVFAFLYTTLLSYCGMGDLLVYVFFGLVPVWGTYYVQAGTTVPEVWWLAAACGLMIDTLLIVNNYRDRDTDRRTGKRTLIVMLGEPFGRYDYLAHGAVAYVCAAMLALYGHLWVAVLAMLYLLPHYLTWRKMVEIRQGRALNRILGFTSRNMLLMGILITLALLIEKREIISTLL